MKKLVAILILCFLTGIATVHAAYQRHQKQPGFFMPTGAMQNTIDKPNFKPRQQPKRTTARQTTPTTSAKKQTAGHKSQSTKNQSTAVQTTKTLLTPKKEKSTIPLQTAAPKPAIEKTAEPIKPAKPDSAVAQIQKEAATPLQTAEDDSSADFSEDDISYNDEDSLYVQSFREYAHDLSLIIKGENVQNPRLQKNLSDFQDIQHQIIVQ